MSLVENDWVGNTFRFVGEAGSSLDSDNELLGLLGFLLTFRWAAEIIEENSAPFFSLGSFRAKKKGEFCNL